MTAMADIAVHLDRDLLAELLPAGAAMVALRATLIVMHHHALADPRLLGIDGRADRDDDPARLVAGDDGALVHGNAARLGLAFRATILMQVAAAHAGRLHFDDDVVGIGGGVFELHQFQFAFAVKDNTAHRSPPLRIFCSQGHPEPKKPDSKGRTPSRPADTNVTGSIVCRSISRFVIRVTRPAAGF